MDNHINSTPKRLEEAQDEQAPKPKVEMSDYEPPEPSLANGCLPIIILLIAFIAAVIYSN